MRFIEITDHTDPFKRKRVQINPNFVVYTVPEEDLDAYTRVTMSTGVVFRVCSLAWEIKLQELKLLECSTKADATGC